MVGYGFLYSPAAPPYSVVESTTARVIRRLADSMRLGWQLD